MSLIYNSTDKVYTTVIDKDTVTIGGDDKATFKPEMLMRKWGEECSLKIKATDTPMLAVAPVLSHDKVDYGDANIGFRWYYKEEEKRTIGDATLQFAEGMEFEIILKKRPLTNTFSFPVESKGLKFWYQAPLNIQETGNPEFDSLTATTASKDGKVCLKRPIHVASSYAVYHESKRNNAYKTGKAFHIYRPLAIDANGKEVWCEFNDDLQDTKILTIIVPQSFLDSAKYPITIDPGLGYTTIGSSTSTYEGYTWGLQESTGVGESGTQTVFKAHMWCGADAHTAYGAVYGAGDPATRQQLSNALDLPTEDGTPANNWQTFTFGTAPTFEAETQYHVAVSTDDQTGGNEISYDDASLVGRYKSSSPICPESWDHGGTGRDHSIYNEFGDETVNYTGEPTSDAVDVSVVAPGALFHGSVIGPTSDAVTLATKAGTYLYDYAVSPTQDALAVATVAPTLGYDYAVAPTQDAVAVAAQAPTLTYDYITAPTQDAVALSVQAPIITGVRTLVTPTADALSVTTILPQELFDYITTATPATISVSANASVTAFSSSSSTVTPTSSAIVVAIQAPVIASGKPWSDWVYNPFTGRFDRVKRVETGIAYTVSNRVPDRTLDTNATTIHELADVLGTLIEDLKEGGVID